MNKLYIVKWSFGWLAIVCFCTSLFLHCFNTQWQGWICYLSTLTIDLEALDPDWKSIIDLRNNESFILLSCFLWMPGTVNVEVKLDDDWESQTFYVAICLGRLPIKQFPRLFALDYNMHLVCCPSCFIMYSFVDFFFHDSLFKFVQMKKIKVWAVVWYYNWKLTDYKAREWLLVFLIRVQINQLENKTLV